MTPTPTDRSSETKTELTRRDFLVVSGLAAVGSYTTTDSVGQIDVPPIALSKLVLTPADLLVPAGERYVEWNVDSDNVALVGTLRTQVSELENAPVAARAYVAREGTNAPRYVESAVFAQVPKGVDDSLIEATSEWFRAAHDSAVEVADDSASVSRLVHWSADVHGADSDVLRLNLAAGFALFSAVLGPRAGIVTPDAAVESYSRCVCSRVLATD